MRYLIGPLLVTTLAATSCIDYTFSQDAPKNRSQQQTNMSSSFTFGDMLANPLKDGSLVEARVSQMALTAFRNSYQNVTYSKWYRARRNYLVSFKVNKYLNRALYDFKGKLISSFFYGSENDLPSEVKGLVKDSYPNYNIFLTTKVYQAGRNIWVINLDNQKTLVCISMQNDLIQELSRYTKSK